VPRIGRVRLPIQALGARILLDHHDLPLVNWFPIDTF
jgi:hypothetical protein